MQSLAVAVQFLTVLPVPAPASPRPEQLGRAVALFPVVGALLGLVCMAVDGVAALFWPIGVGTALVLATLVVSTGALHLDGFLDTCDGLFLWQPERRLAAMRDSRVGGFAVAGGLSLYLVKFAALASVAGPGRPAALVLGPTLGRLGIVWALVLFPYLRPAGMGVAFKAGSGLSHLTAGTLAALVISAAFGPIGVIALAGATAAAWLLSRFVCRRLAGMTGDTYGFVCEAVETLTLLVVAAAPVRLTVWDGWLTLGRS